MSRLPIITTILLLVALGVTATGRADDRDKLADEMAVLGKLKPEAIAKFGDAQFLFTGKLDRVIPGPVARSLPPIYSHQLKFTVGEVLRGSLKPGQELTCSHSARQRQPPKFPEGQDCLVTAAEKRGRMVVTSIWKSGPERVAAARVVCRLPLGWTVKEGRLLCPWAGLGGGAWPADQKVIGALACAETGRPALLAGEGVKMEVAPVPPEKKIKWTNPDGDGQYKIAVTNTTDGPVKVPALLSDGKNILWDESLVVLCQGKTYTVPGSKGVRGKVGPAELKPGQSVWTVVNVFKLQGPKWPRGGYRIEFQFCLGQKSNVQSFYYLSRHHDKVRQKAQAE